MIPDLARRSGELELMDDPACDTAALLRTTEQFGLSNRLFSRYRSILKRWVLADMRLDRGREWHLMDLGSGGMDIPRWLLAAARRRGLRLRVTAVESDPRIVEHVRRAFAANPELEIVCADARDLLRRGATADYVFCNHLLHHLPESALPDFLRLVDRAVRQRFVISDLLRSRASYAGYAAASLLLLRASFARPDGLLSIQRGFLPEELRDLVRRAGLEGRAEVHCLVPGRLVLVGGMKTNH